MIRFLLILSFIFIHDVEPIKAISYNIRYNNPNDGINVWKNRRETVTELLNEQNADSLRALRQHWQLQTAPEREDQRRHGAVSRRGRV